MARQRITQAVLASHIGLSQTAVSRRLTGEVPFDVNELAAAAEVLGVTAQYLLSGAQQVA